MSPDSVDLIPRPGVTLFDVIDVTDFGFRGHGVGREIPREIFFE